MARRLTPLVTDFYYHVFNRGVNKRRIFLNKRDHQRAINLARFYRYLNYPIRFSKFLLLHRDQRKEIWQRLEKDEKFVDVLSYCLMPNHFHFLVKQNVDNGVSKFMSNFENSYTKYFNIKNSRVGPLLQGPFKAVKIDSEEQLLHVSRYIHLNPYSSAVVGSLNDLINYPWSSFPEYISGVEFNFCQKDLLLSQFKNQDSYKVFVFDNADYQKTLEDVKHLTLE